MSAPFEALWVGSHNLEPYTLESTKDLMDDPRGILLAWDPPKRSSKYIIGVDPTQGITGWSRYTRTPSDHKTDNAAIVVFEVDAIKIPIYKDMPNPTGKGYIQVPDLDPVTKQPKVKWVDKQVAEWAGPCDAVEIARIANIVGRVYAGIEDDQCELIHEAYPGPGVLTTQELIRLGYGNMWYWEYIADGSAEQSHSVGWRSTVQSQKLLWTRSRRHMMNEQAIIRSKWLLAEYANAEIDMEKMRARAAYGYHDDRFQAANMAFWAGHKWTYDAERTEEVVQSAPVIDFQRYAPTIEDYKSHRERWEEALAEWE